MIENYILLLIGGSIFVIPLIVHIIKEIMNGRRFIKEKRQAKKEMSNKEWIWIK